MTLFRISISANVAKQMMEKMLLRKFRPNHDCVIRMKPISVSSTPRSRDDLVYTFEEQEHRMFKVIEIEGGGSRLICREYIISGKIFRRHPTLEFDKVGVYNNHGFKTVRTELQLAEIKGKVFSFGSLLMTIPMNVLTER